jgi:hypothetical protein
VSSVHRITRSVALLGVAVASCAPAFRAARPRLTSLAPDSVQLLSGNVTEVDLRGSGFDTSRTAPLNIVRIGSLVLRAVPSSPRGTLIRVAIPASAPSGGEAPGAPWMGGRYPVTVTTPRGTSDTLTLAITSLGSRP